MKTEFDLIVFGATAFTGRLAAQYLLSPSDRAPLRIALAGRNLKKLEDLALQCQVKPQIIYADSSDQASIDTMVARTRCVLSFAGPFSLYGEPLIAACARLGRDYLDITGETPFIRQMIERYQNLAESTGARLIPFSGFDSVPADLCMHLARSASQSRGISLDDFSFYYQLQGGFNGGTLASALHMAESAEGRQLFNPNALILDARWPKGPRSAMGPSFEAVLQRWSFPFFMNPVNRAVVRRSAWLLAPADQTAARFGYEERLLVGRSLGALQAGLGTGLLAGFGFLTGSKAGRSILNALGPKPGEGPSAERRKHGFFRGQLIGRSQNLAKIIIRMQGEGDPGNELTIRMACESARLAAENLFKTEQKGFLTPSVAFADDLVQRLGHAGFRFETQWL
ncbi:MAG: saccharopine dehydrogenase NADP-binding domain-containing protein [Proteobacteria bacterium]|nr:saccharopine dehydrogenase NADP-binding domain-containing protein [Pseudomonadota bacterium]